MIEDNSKNINWRILQLNAKTYIVQYKVRTIFGREKWYSILDGGIEATWVAKRETLEDAKILLEERIQEHKERDAAIAFKPKVVYP